MAADTHDLDRLDPTMLRARRSAKWNRYDPDVLAMWVAETDFPTAAPVQEAVRRAVEAEAYGYPLPAQESGLAVAMTDYQRTAYGWEVDPMTVHLVGDVMKGIGLTLQHLAPAGSTVVIPTPVYMPFFETVRLSGHEQVNVPVRAGDGRWELDIEAVDAGLASSRTPGVVLLCSPHNPLGAVWDRPQLEALAAVVDRRGALVISDEIHAPLVFGSTHVPYASLSPVTAAHTVTVTSASKAWNVPGLKCAQVVTSAPEHLARWRAIPFEATIGTGTLGIEANLAAYREGTPWMDAVRERLDHNRDLVADALRAMGIRHLRNQATYLAWLDCRELDLGADPAQWLLKHARVALSPGGPFRPEGAGFARLNFATTATILDDALQRMGDALSRRPSGAHR